MLSEDARRALSAMRGPGPMPEAQIARIEEILGRPLPADLRAVYAAHGSVADFAGGAPALKAAGGDEDAEPVEIEFHGTRTLANLYALLRERSGAHPYPAHLLDGWIFFATNGAQYEYACRAGDPRIFLCGLFNLDHGCRLTQIADDLSALLTRTCQRDFDAAVERLCELEEDEEL